MSQHRARALVIDDEQPIAEMLRDFFEFIGVEAHIATGGAEGLALFAQGNYDLVLTDLVMPGTTGLDVVDTVRRTNPQVKILLLTGSALPGFLDPLRERGIEVLTKPITLAQFKAAVENALAG